MRALLIAGLVCFPILAAAQEQHPLVSGNQVNWGLAPPVFPKGAQMAVLAGDPGKPGLFIIRLKMPAGYKIPAHQHPTDENLTIISGNFYVGMGNKLDQARGAEINQGGFVSLPAKMNHFAWTGGESIVEIASEGPFAMTYVDPKDDPTKSQ